MFMVLQKSKFLALLNLLNILQLSLLHADIDATVTPSVVNNYYILSNGEKIDGFVDFKEGFELPMGGTVDLNLAKGQQVRGPINLNGGTMRLREDIYFIRPQFSGKGFVTGGGRYIYLNDDTIRFSKTTAQLVFLQNFMRIQGVNRPRIIIEEEGIDLSQNINFLFENVRLFILNESGIITNTAMGVQRIDFFSCDISTRSNFILPASQALFAGSNFIESWQNVNFQFNGGLIIVAQSDLYVGAGSEVVAKEEFSVKPSARFILDNSKLDLISTLTTPFALGDAVNVNSQGDISIVGRSILTSSTGNNISFPNKIVLNFTPGSRLELSSGTQLILN